MSTSVTARVAGQAVAQTAAHPARPAHPEKPRVAVWDNARFVLIALVVIGHAISTEHGESALGYGIYTFIYLFHMPAMILLSGMFSRTEVSRKTVRTTLGIVVTWLVWEGIWALVHALDGHAPASTFLIVPGWTLWFLVSLATMRILLPYFAGMRHPLLVSIVMALASGAIPDIGSSFSASRTLSFMPFFVLGWMIRERGWLDRDWFTRRSAARHVAGWGVFAAIIAVLALLPGLRKYWHVGQWLLWRDEYFSRVDEAPIGGWQPEGWGGITLTGVLVSAMLMLVAAAMTFALLCVVPRGRSVITTWGSRTLYVYLLHAPVIWVLRKTGVFDRLSGLGTLGIAAIAAGSVLLAVLLSMRWATRATHWIVEPRTDWLVRRETPQRPEARRSRVAKSP